VGCAQLKKLPDFVERRRHNWSRLRDTLLPARDKLILPEPAPNSRPSWFGFLLTVREGVERQKLVRYLEEKGIQTRLLFSGNLLRHPCFDAIRSDKNRYRIAGTLGQTDRVMRDTFWVGVYPGLDDRAVDYMGQTILQGIKLCV